MFHVKRFHPLPRGQASCLKRHQDLPRFIAPFPDAAQLSAVDSRICRYQHDDPLYSFRRLIIPEGYFSRERWRRPAVVPAPGPPPEPYRPCTFAGRTVLQVHRYRRSVSRETTGRSPPLDLSRSGFPTSPAHWTSVDHRTRNRRQTDRAIHCPSSNYPTRTNRLLIVLPEEADPIAHPVSESGVRSCHSAALAGEVSRGRH